MKTVLPTLSPVLLHRVRRYVCVAALATLSLPAAAFAQAPDEEEAPDADVQNLDGTSVIDRMFLQFDGGSVFGDFGEVAPWLFGFHWRYEHPIVRDLNFTGQIGMYIYGTEAPVNSLSEIPLQLGIEKNFPLAFGVRPYVFGTAGASLMSREERMDGGKESSGSIELSAQAGIGVQPVDFGQGYEFRLALRAPSLAHPTDGFVALFGISASMEVLQ